MKNSSISAERLAKVVFSSYDEFKEDTNGKPLEVASMVISNVSKAMMENNYNKVLVFRCLISIALKVNDKELESYMHSLVHDTTSDLSSSDRAFLFHSIEAAIASSDGLKE